MNVPPIPARLFLSALALVLPALLITAPAGPAAANLVQLKREIVVEQDVVRLGDLFDGLSEKQDVRVGSAPEPGQRAVYGLRQIRQLARAHGLNWRPAAGRRHVVIRRAANEISREALTDLIAGGLADRRPEQRYQISIGGMNPPLVVAADSDPTLALKSFDFDSRTGRFTARVRAGAADRSGVTSRVSGIARPIYRVLTVSRPVGRGELLRADMLEWRDVPQRQAGSSSLHDESQVIGMAARRALRPGQALRAGDLQQPVVLQRGDIVNMVYDSPGLRLTTAARALEDGALGQTIAISNLRSKRTVYAVVEAPNVVRVSTQRLDLAAVRRP